MMRQVTQAEFYAAIGPLNVHPAVRGRYTDPNYGSDFHTNDSQRRLVGRTVAVGPTPHWKPDSEYFLNEHLVTR